MIILVIIGDVKIRFLEDVNGILEIFFYFFGVKKRYFMGLNGFFLCCNFMVFLVFLFWIILKCV